MQKDIQKSKGEQKHEPSKEANKVQEVGNDINASLKENVGVGVGNYSSKVDREKSREHKEKYEEKKNKEEKEKNKKLDSSEKKWDEKKESGPVSSKVQEIGRNLNANLKENVGVGVGNYPSEVDREKANEHRENYEEKTEDQKEKFNEKKEEMKERIESGETTGIYAHRIQEVGHNINATLKENIGVGLGNYPSEVDREKATEHREKYDERVKEETKPEIGEATSLGHKIREVAHNINANLKEMIGIGVGNYSSEVDRELATVHKEKYDEMTHTNEFDNTEDKEFKKDDDKQEKEVEGLKSEKKEQPTKKDLNTKESKLDESSKSKSGFGDNKL